MMISADVLVTSNFAQMPGKVCIAVFIHATITGNYQQHKDHLSITRLFRLWIVDVDRRCVNVNPDQTLEVSVPVRALAKERSSRDNHLHLCVANIKGCHLQIHFLFATSQDLTKTNQQQVKNFSSLAHFLSSRLL